MCEIGKPIEIMNVEPLSLPAPLSRREQALPEQSVTVEVPMSATTFEPSHVEKL
jgi:hypothetical protein